MTGPTSGLLDLASPARWPEPPPWLLSRLERALPRLGSAPDPAAATRAVAARHGRPVEQVLVTAGATEALTLLARALRPRHAVCVHPAAPRAELALRAAGHEVERLVLTPPYVLDPADVAPDADLVVVAQPAGATGVVQERLAELCRPGRVVVVDESLADGTPGEPQSLSGRGDLPGLVVVRSLSATWALAGLRVGYLLADAVQVKRLRAAQPPRAVGALALVALETCSGRGPVRAAEKQAAALGEERERLEPALRALGVEVAAGSQAPFLLCHVPGRPDLPEALRDQGVLVRPVGDVPGLTADHWRVAVRDADATGRLLEALTHVLAGR